MSATRGGKRSGAGRPRKDPDSKRRTVSFSMDPEVIEALESVPPRTRSKEVEAAIRARFSCCASREGVADHVFVLSEILRRACTDEYLAVLMGHADAVTPVGCQGSRDLAFRRDGRPGG